MERCKILGNGNGAFAGPFFRKDATQYPVLMAVLTPKDHFDITVRGKNKFNFFQQISFTFALLPSAQSIPENRFPGNNTGGFRKGEKRFNAAINALGYASFFISVASQGAVEIDIKGGQTFFRKSRHFCF